MIIKIGLPVPNGDLYNSHLFAFNCSQMVSEMICCKNNLNKQANNFLKWELMFKKN